ncbi:phosphatase PAP2 family protein [uncultured Oceanisphaera sp.]|uniref:phosphatase PAP2 family protein n=1 Tax=uncultured Oceanisphaera sp. TaxID=353858 RepID=UPI0026185345|nr:phosphatase PAP2 family protein [uncultured Oceanisphaera sp.]
MIFELFEDVIKLTLIVVSLHFALGIYVRRRQPAWSGALERRRLLILCALVLAVTAIKVTEDVLDGESGPFDHTVLLFIRGHLSPTLTGFFEAITLTGSAMVLVPLTIITTVGLLLAGRRVEAVLVAASVISAAAVVYVIKMVVGRARPELWQTEWYWGSSFPSGHTLVVTAFATAVALSISRMVPAARRFALAVAMLWVMLVGFSRMVLGVHWPTDVLVATCIGTLLPLLINMYLALRHGRR